MLHVLQVMLAASYWSLLAPAVEMAEASHAYGPYSFLPPCLGFMAGAAFVYLADLLLPILVSPCRVFVFMGVMQVCGGTSLKGHL